MGQTLFLKPELDEEWQVIEPSGQEDAKMVIDPITCADVMNLGLPMFIVGHASGLVRLYLCETGQKICEIGAHSR